MPKFYSADLNSPLTLSVQNDFSGGQYSDYNPVKIIESGVLYAKNCILNRVGELETRRGYLEIDSTTSGSIVDCVAAINTVGTKVAVVFSGGSTYTCNGNTLSALSGYAYNAGDNAVMAVQSGNKLYAVDGLNNLYYTDGATWSANESPDVNPCPSAMDIIISHDKKLLVSGVSNGPETIYVSDIHLNAVPEFDQNLWKFDVAADGTKITAMCPWYESYFAVFKRNKTYVVNAVREAESAAQWTIDIADNNVGCIAKKTPVAINGDIYFLSDDGVRKLVIAADGSQYRISPSISRPIDDIIRRIRKDKVHLCHAKHRENRYILYLPIVGLIGQLETEQIYLTDENGDILTDENGNLFTIGSESGVGELPSDTCNCAVVWNTTMNGGAGGWEGYWVGDNISASDVVELDDGLSYFIAGDDIGVVYALSDYKQDDEVGAIDYSLETEIATRAFDFSELFNEKRPRHAEIYAKHSFGGSDTVILGASVDGGEFAEVRQFSATSGGFTFPITFPLMIGGSSYKTLKAGIGDLGRFRDIAFRIKTNNGRLNLRSVASAAFVKTFKKGHDIVGS